MLKTSLKLLIILLFASAKIGRADFAERLAAVKPEVGSLIDFLEEIDTLKPILTGLNQHNEVVLPRIDIYSPPISERTFSLSFFREVDQVPGFFIFPGHIKNNAQFNLRQHPETSLVSLKKTENSIRIVIKRTRTGRGYDNGSTFQDLYLRFTQRGDVEYAELKNYEKLGFLKIPTKGHKVKFWNYNASNLHAANLSREVPFDAERVKAVKTQRAKKALELLNINETKFIWVAFKGERDGVPVVGVLKLAKGGGGEYNEDWGRFALTYANDSFGRNLRIDRSGIDMLLDSSATSAQFDDVSTWTDNRSPAQILSQTVSADKPQEFNRMWHFVNETDKKDLETMAIRLFKSGNYQHATDVLEVYGDLLNSLPTEKRIVDQELLGLVKARIFHFPYRTHIQFVLSYAPTLTKKEARYLFSYFSRSALNDGTTWEARKLLMENRQHLKPSHLACLDTAKYMNQSPREIYNYFKGVRRFFFKPDFL